MCRRRRWRCTFVPNSRGLCWKKRAFPQPCCAACARAVRRGLPMCAARAKGWKTAGRRGAAGWHGRAAAGTVENKALCHGPPAPFCTGRGAWRARGPARAALPACAGCGRSGPCCAATGKTGGQPAAFGLAGCAGKGVAARRAQVAALHAAAEDFAALCLASPRPMGTAYTQKFIAPPKG